MSATVEAPVRASSPTRAAAGAFVGGVVEWYDFFVYGTAAALVIDQLFFPASDPTAGTLLALATFGIAFVARPVGGVLFGHLGDRAGRRTVLIATLGLMGGSTFLIGVLPTYATLGEWAVVLLVTLRLLQGLAAGGELGGAAALAVESAPPGRRGFFGSFAVAGASAGIALGSSVFGLVLLLPREDFLAWGWRVPFLVSVVVLVVGHLVRRSVAEPEMFRRAAAAPGTADRARRPVVEVLRTFGSRVAVATVVYSAGIVGFYIVSVYALSYARTTLAPNVAAVAVSAVTVTTFVSVVMAPVWGAVSDRVGRRPLVVGGALVQAGFVFAFFAALPTGNFVLILATTIGTLSLGQVAIIGVTPAYLSEMFPTGVRVTGISLAIGLSAVVAGFAPLAATAVVDAGEGWPMVAALTAGISVLGAIAALCLRETRDVDLTRVGGTHR